MSAVFLDTVGLLALWDADDQWHDKAEEAYIELLGRRATFLTTTFAFLECGNAAARRTFRRDVIDLRRLLDDRKELLRPSEEDWVVAWQMYEKSDAAGAGIVDCISFSIMRRLGLTETFSNDRHFSAAGFRTLF